MKILVPTDFSDCATTAQTTAIDLARRLGGEIVLLHVLVEAPLYGEGLLSTARVQSVYDAQRKWAEGALGLNRVLLGSVAERVIRLAPCPVLTVRRPGGSR